MKAVKNAEGRFVKNKVVVDRLGPSKDFVELLYSKNFFGSLDDSSLVLSLFEACFLVDQGKLVVRDSRGAKLSYSVLVSRFSRVEKNFLAKFLAFKDLRSRGYFLRSGLKYGCDFLVYDRGKKPGENHSDWLLFVFSKSDKFSWTSWVGNNRVSHSVRKKSLICVVDAGELTYYTVSWFRP